MMNSIILWSAIIVTCGLASCSGKTVKNGEGLWVFDRSEVVGAPTTPLKGTTLELNPDRSGRFMDYKGSWREVSTNHYAFLFDDPNNAFGVVISAGRKPAMIDLEYVPTDDHLLLTSPRPNKKHAILARFRRR